MALVYPLIWGRSDSTSPGIGGYKGLVRKSYMKANSRHSLAYSCGKDCEPLNRGATLAMLSQEETSVYDHCPNF